MASTTLPLATSSGMMDLDTSSHKSPTTAQSAPDSSRRHSLPSSFLAAKLPNAIPSGASGVAAESDEAARGENTLNELAAHRLSALRQLNGGRVRGHRYAKSTGARSSTFNQPVIVRTYSGASRPRSQHREPLGVRKENIMTKSKAKANAKLPPIEAFTFKGIMEEIKHDVSEDLERIAEICARSKYSLSNQYEVHMPPHGRGDPILQATVAPPGRRPVIVGPTLQAIESDDEHSRAPSRPTRGPRRTRSAAQGTLETIMSSSRSSDEDQSKKKPAAELAEEVRGRMARKATSSTENGKGTQASSKPRSLNGHVRAKSMTASSAFIENITTVKHANATTSTFAYAGTSIRPRTSAGPSIAETAPNVITHPVTRLTRRQSEQYGTRSAATTSNNILPTIVENINSWLPWKANTAFGELNAECSLKNLLSASSNDGKRSTATG